MKTHISFILFLSVLSLMASANAEPIPTGCRSEDVGKRLILPAQHYFREEKGEGKFPLRIRFCGLRYLDSEVDVDPKKVNVAFLRQMVAFQYLDGDFRCGFGNSKIFPCGPSNQKLQVEIEMGPFPDSIKKFKDDFLVFVFGTREQIVKQRNPPVASSALESLEKIGLIKSRIIDRFPPEPSNQISEKGQTKKISIKSKSGEIQNGRWKVSVQMSNSDPENFLEITSYTRRRDFGERYANPNSSLDSSLGRVLPQTAKIILPLGFNFYENDEWKVSVQLNEEFLALSPGEDSTPKIYCGGYADSCNGEDCESEEQSLELETVFDFKTKIVSGKSNIAPHGLCGVFIRTKQ